MARINTDNAKSRLNETRQPTVWVSLATEKNVIHKMELLSKDF